MSRLFFTVILLQFGLLSFGQSAYYDALVLRSCVGVNANGAQFLKNRQPSVDSILTKYAFGIKPGERLLHYYKDGLKPNPFIRTFLPSDWPSASDAPVDRSQVGSFNLPGIASSIGGLDVTTIADGFAKFIVSRTKQELNMAFFNKFSELLSRPAYQDLRTVFPQTYSVMNVLGDEIYNYQAYLAAFREAFKNDLNALAMHLPSIIDNHPDFFARYAWLAATLQSGCYIAEAINDKQHPGDILRDYPTMYLDSLNPNCKAAIKTLQLFSASLRDSSKSPDSAYWVGTEKMKMLVNDSITFRIYLGLLYQHARNEVIVFRSYSAGVPKYDTLTTIFEQARDFQLYRNYVARFTEKANRITRMVKNYRKMPSDSLTVEQYAAYFDASLDLIEHASQVGNLVPKSWGNEADKRYLFYLKDSLSEYFDVAHSVSNLVLNVNREEYASAVVNLVHIYNMVFADMAARDMVWGDAGGGSKKAHRNAIKQVRNIGGDELLARVRNRMLSAVDSTKIMAQASVIYAREKYVEFRDSREVAHTVLRYGTFMSALVLAENSDEAEDAIESFALPPGSSRIKRETPFNVSVNAYAGLFAGYEKIQGVAADKPFTFQGFNSTGVTAPIGIAFSFGKFSNVVVPNGRGHWSHSLFISVADLGAVTAFRFQSSNDSIKQLPAIQLKDIISPGLFWSIGIPKSPISLNLGAQIGPNLRKVESKFNDYSNNMYWRYSMSLCVDLPLLNLYTKSAE